MSSKRLAFLSACLCVLSHLAFAQKDELSATVGRTFVSTQTIQNDPTSPNPKIHFGNEESFAVNYARLWKNRGTLGFSVEVPVAIFPSMDLNTGLNQIPKTFGGLFITPSLRVNFFSGQSFSPWASVGGGYTRFWESSNLNYFGSSHAPTGVNTGAVQFGVGFDVWPWRRWGIRAEARDFYSGVPDLNANPSLPATTGRSRQHNYYVGVGVIRHF
jgi:hypothetical protein